MGLLTVSNLSKGYKKYPSRWARLAEWLDPRDHAHHVMHWVLRDISFAIEPGEAVGLIGTNGAGKSTLLKLITGTTLATQGQIAITGRVAALLELGMGFHPDFTGRQNAIMAGQLLGYSAADMIDRWPSIEEFAEIGAYVDQPVRYYSSGMQMRLAFAVATAFRPDLLIIDEALSVGDAYFQHKSFARIRDFKQQGTTLLIVSHDAEAIKTICDRAFLLHRGQLELEGDPPSVMDYYNALIAAREGSILRQNKLDDGTVQTLSGTGDVHLDAIRLLNPEGDDVSTALVGQDLELVVRVVAQHPVDDLVIGYMIKDRLGHEIFGTNTHHMGLPIDALMANDGVTLRCRFPCYLGPGSYSISIALHNGPTHLGRNYAWKDLALVFEVINTREKVFVGTSWLPPRMEVE